MIVFDTNAVIYLLEGRSAIQFPLAETAISIVTKIKLLSCRFVSAQEMRPVDQFIRALRVIALSGEVSDKTVELRRETRLKLSDAIIAATAIAYDADLLSNDIAFQGIPKLRVVTPKGTLPPT